MDISKVGIDTMGVADNPKYEKDDERDIYYQHMCESVAGSGKLNDLVYKHIENHDSDEFERALVDLYATQDSALMFCVLIDIVDAEAERLTTKKFGY